MLDEPADRERATGGGESDLLLTETERRVAQSVELLAEETA